MSEFWCTFRHHSCDSEYAVFAILHNLQNPQLDKDPEGAIKLEPLTEAQRQERDAYNDRLLRIAAIARWAARKPEMAGDRVSPDGICRVMTAAIRNAGIDLPNPITHSYIPYADFPAWAADFRAKREASLG